ncbi:MAG: lysylphosphatidylglycerol synthase transmembrane domain-containing protein [Ktedonobacterales bacterium]
MAGTMAGLMRFFKRYKRFIQAGVLALIVVFLGVALYKSWTQLSSYSWHVQWPLLIAALALATAQELSFALIWRSILARLGSKLDIISSERIYLGAEFVRYIPGNVWHVITRVLWAEQRGVSKSIGLASMVIELATKIASAALVFAVTLLFWPDVSGLSALNIPNSALITIGGLGIPLILVLLYPRLLGAALNFGLKLLKREPITLTMNYLDLLLVTFYWSASWVVAGVGFYLLVLSVTGAAPALFLLIIGVGIYALGWDIGFLTFVTPSGLGFREVVIAALLIGSGLVTGAAASAVSIVIALLWRLLTTGAELASITCAYLISGGKAPTLPVAPSGPGGPANPVAPDHFRGGPVRYGPPYVSGANDETSVANATTPPAR